MSEHPKEDKLSTWQELNGGNSLLNMARGGARRRKRKQAASNIDNFELTATDLEHMIQTHRRLFNLAHGGAVAVDPDKDHSSLITTEQDSTNQTHCLLNVATGGVDLVAENFELSTTDQDSTNQTQCLLDIATGGADPVAENLKLSTTDQDHMNQTHCLLNVATGGVDPVAENFELSTTDQAIIESKTSFLEEENNRVQKLIYEQDSEILKTGFMLNQLDLYLDEITDDFHTTISALENEMNDQEKENIVLMDKIDEMSRSLFSIIHESYNKDEIIAKKNQELFSQSIRIEHLHGELKEVEMKWQDLENQEDETMAKVLSEQAIATAQMVLPTELQLEDSQQEQFELKAELAQVSDHNDKLDMKQQELATEKEEIKSRIEEGRIRSNAEIDKLKEESERLERVLKQLKVDVSGLKEDMTTSEENHTQEINNISIEHRNVISTLKKSNTAELKRIEQQATLSLDELKAQQDDALVRLKKRYLTFLKNAKEAEETLHDCLLEISYCKCFLFKPKMKIDSAIEELKHLKIYIREISLM